MRKPMSLEHRLKLRKNHVFLANEMQLEYMIPYFIQEGVLTYEMAEELRLVAPFSMNMKLLAMLPHRGDNAYSTLIAALKYGSGQMHLVDMLEGTVVLEKEMEDLEAELSRRSRSQFSSLSGQEESSSNNNSRLENYQDPSRLMVPERTKKVKVRRTRKSRCKGAHREELPDISHLLPYVVPHVKKKWNRLAEELGLTETDMSHIVVIPHEKQSHYADLVLKTWIKKDRAKATKQKLTQALQAIGSKRAVEAISIYDVPVFKAKILRKTSTNSIMVSENTIPTKLPEIISPKTENSRKQYVQLTSALLRRSGHLPVRCTVKRVSSRRESVAEIDHTQKAFLNLADKITDSMVEQGEQATEILNAVERLQGIVFHKVYKGSVALETQVLHLLALERLMKLYTSGEFTDIIERVFVTPALLSEYHAKEVRLSVQISEPDYLQCKRELLALVKDCKPSVSDSEYDSCYTTDQTDQSDTDEETCELADNPVTLKCVQLLADVREYLAKHLFHLNRNVSDLLMTLQLIHPPTVSKISTMDDLMTFRGYIGRTTPSTLSTTSIDQFIDIHQQFVEKISSLRSQISAILYTEMSKTTDMELRLQQVNSAKVQKCVEGLTAAQRMLNFNYDFSLLTHAETVQMTTLETLCYRGLFSYHYVVLDKLGECRTYL